METATLTGFLTALLTAILVGLLAALVTYVILWLVGLVVRMDEALRRQVSAVVGVLVALLSLLGYLT